MSQSLVGQTLRSRYEIFKLLGAGGFGDTYLAYDCDLPRKPQRVVKHLAPKGLDPKDFHLAERLFKQEAELLYTLGEQHDQIHFLYAYFQEGGQFYLVQEFLESGHDLTQEIPPGQKLEENDMLELLDEILSVLSFVHENGVIHRDIKPQNIMRRERDGKLFLIDFGAVKEINVMTTDGRGQTSLTVGIGSPGFMPSEQAAGRPKLSSDVYSVGMIGVNCLTGVQPSQLNEDKQTGELMWRHLAQVSEKTSQFLQTMVRDHFSQRFETATVAHSKLTALISSSKNIPNTSKHTISEQTKFQASSRLSTLPISSIGTDEDPPIHTPSDNSIPITPLDADRGGGPLVILGIAGLALVGVVIGALNQNLSPQKVRISSSQDPLVSSETQEKPVVSSETSEDLSAASETQEEPAVSNETSEDPSVASETQEDSAVVDESPRETLKNILPSNNRQYFVVTDYSDNIKLKDIQNRLFPDAKVVNFTAGTRILLKKFDDESEAREFAANTQQQGLAVEILATTLPGF